jgi:hypothetical protein
VVQKTSRRENRAAVRREPTGVQGREFRWNGVERHKEKKKRNTEKKAAMKDIAVQFKSGGKQTKPTNTEKKKGRERTV